MATISDRSPRGDLRGTPRPADEAPQPATVSIRLIDTTLRDGEQAPGVAFTTHERSAVATLLSDLGIPEIEVGVPAMGAEEVESIREIARLGLKAELTCWARAQTEDIVASTACGVPNLHICFPTSERQLRLLDQGVPWLVARVESCIEQALKYFDRVTVGALDGTRTDESTLRVFAELAHSCGARRVRIADTVGVGWPGSIAELFGGLVNALPDVEFEFHGHNDLGMATANSMVAVDTGARAVSVTVNGLGERAGNTPLEEFVMAARLSQWSCGDIRTHQLRELCETVASYSGRPLGRDKPIVGTDVFAHESGIHVNGLLRDAETYQPFRPADVGAEGETFIVGKHSGSLGIVHALSERGVSITRDEARTLLPHVRRFATTQKRPLNGVELESLYRAVTGSS